MDQTRKLKRPYRKRRCPKKGCGGRIGALRERMLGWEFWEVDAKGVATPLGAGVDRRAPVEATCARCGHRWKLRRINLSIEQLFED